MIFDIIYNGYSINPVMWLDSIAQTGEYPKGYGVIQKMQSHSTSKSTFAPIKYTTFTTIKEAMQYIDSIVLGQDT